MPADLPGWLREEAQKLRERGGPPRGGEAVAIITEHYARVAEEMLAAEVARVRADVAEEIARAIERDDMAMYAWEAARIARGCAVAPAESVVGALPPSGRCPARYERPGGRQVGDRIVACHLQAGHPGEHEEADTEMTWEGDD